LSRAYQTLHAAGGRSGGAAAGEAHPEGGVRDQGEVVVDAGPPDVEIGGVIADGHLQRVGSSVRVRGAVDDEGRGRGGARARALGRALLHPAPAAAHPRVETRRPTVENGRVGLAQAPAGPAALPERGGAAAKLLAAGVDAGAAVIAQQEAALATFAAA